MRASRINYATHGTTAIDQQYTTTAILFEQIVQQPVSSKHFTVMI
jgi:hypothetical protein